MTRGKLRRGVPLRGGLAHRIALLLPPDSGPPAARAARFPRPIEMLLLETSAAGNKNGREDPGRSREFMPLLAVGHAAHRLRIGPIVDQKAVAVRHLHLRHALRI